MHEEGENNEVLLEQVDCDGKFVSQMLASVSAMTVGLLMPVRTKADKHRQKLVGWVSIPMTVNAVGKANTKGLVFVVK